MTPYLHRYSIQLLYDLPGKTIQSPCAAAIKQLLNATLTATPSTVGLALIFPGESRLGFASLLMDISSEMIHALLPSYLVTELGASTITVGTIKGIAEATASITKIFSGALSDWRAATSQSTVEEHSLGERQRAASPEFQRPISQ